MHLLLQVPGLLLLHLLKRVPAVCSALQASGAGTPDESATLSNQHNATHLVLLPVPGLLLLHPYGGEPAVCSALQATFYLPPTYV
jgi:hypothetical protein